jgi:hypothetical protein
MRTALRAQNQCPANLETLAALKNPQVIFAKQANVSQCHQQINNYPGALGESEQSKLLPDRAYEQLDTRTATTPSGVDSPVGAINGTPHARGKS